MSLASKFRSLLLALLVLVFWMLPAPVACAQNESQQQITLKQQLEFGLRARTPQEFAHIQTIVNLVETDVVPRRIVNMAFLWARKKSRYPYPYFSRALVILGQREGVIVPPGPY